MIRLAILDSDHIVWRCAGSCEPTKAKPFLESKEDAISRADMLMHRILHQLNTSFYESYISGTGNWRKEIYPEYKANRIGKPVPTWLEDVREFLITEWKSKIVNDIEVDDICGIRLTAEEDAICVSLDKDLLTIPGQHFNFVTEQYTLISPLDATRRFYSQLITGDASDNIPAFDGKLRTSVPKFVQALLDPLQEMTEALEMYNYVSYIYEKDCGYLQNSWAQRLEIMHRNAKCLFIQTKEGEQWEVPKNGHQQENILS